MQTIPDIITVSLNPAIDRIIEVENFAAGAHLPGREKSRVPAGKALNVSRVLAKFGVPCIATGFLGRENREVFDELLRDPMVRDEFFLLPGRTRENVTLADRASGQETHVRDVGLEVPGVYRDRLSRKLRLLSRPGVVVVFSGSLPPGVSVEDFLRLIEVCAEQGAKVAVDTSGEAFVAGTARKLWLIKPNILELGHLAGRDLNTPAEFHRAARELTSHVDVVLLTLGDEGACLFTREQGLHCRVPIDPQRVRNTVGCGDVLLGAFLASVWRKRPLAEALADAVAAASAGACTLGTAEFDLDVMHELRGKASTENLLERPR